MTEEPIKKAIEEIKLFNKKHNLIARGSLNQQVEESVKEGAQLALILQDKQSILELKKLIYSFKNNLNKDAKKKWVP